ncbi:Response regulator of zinc sigma-54-dependent two-component system [hydrothermal vent metagenome]|uniref:Response regulator of zinc sigma-54-dependent two-component system n=1 Tax=hydrothermal vent metagenome TaxID=652676 RepID=A0A3B1A6A1_9ZZZZ
MAELNFAPMMEAIISYIEEGVFIADHKGNVIYQNPTAGQMLGSPDEPITKLRDIGDFNLQRTLIKAAIDAGEIDAAGRPTGQFVKFEHRVKTNEGYRYLEFYSGLVSNSGWKDRLRLILVRDRTEQRQLEAVFKPGVDNFSTNDPRMLEILNRIQQVAPTQAAVLLQGESGSGKTQIARMIHQFSDRAHMPFIEVNCAAIPESLIESELFGHIKGSFTGAIQDRAGRFQAADGGTLFLDEVSEIPLHLQAKLLKAVQEQSFEMVGSDESVNVNVRIISASNLNLRDQVNKNGFRADLYYRLAVIPLTIPALRERPGDMPVLIKHFCNRMAKRGYENSKMECNPDAMKLMLNYPWPGNVRELENAVEHGIICAQGDSVGPESLPQHIQDFSLAHKNQQPPQSSALATDHIQRQQIENALKETQGNKSQAAQLLGVDRSTLWRRMQRFGLDR